MHIVGEDLLRAFYKFFMFTVFCFKWSVKKHCVAKILQGIWRRFLYENNRNFNSYKSSHKFNFISFLSFHKNQKQESNFQQVGGLVTSNILLFVDSESRYTSKVCRDSIDFYEIIFLNVIPLRIIVPCFKESNDTPRFPSFRFCPMLEIENLETSESLRFTSNFYRFGCIKHGKD